MLADAVLAIAASPLDAVSSFGDVDDSIPHGRGKNIGQVANVFLDRGGHDRGVEIRIDVEAGRPPAGRVRTPGGTPVRFDGWLSLLAVLERLVGEQRVGPGRPRSASGASGATSREDRR